MFPTDDSPPGLCINRWRVAYLCVVLFCACGAVAGCITLLSLPSVAADPTCAGTNVVFVAFTLAAGAVLCILSMLDACGNRGLLPAAFIWAYMVFLAWSAIYANPDERCNPIPLSEGASAPAADIFGMTIAGGMLCYTALSASRRIPEATVELFGCGSRRDGALHGPTSRASSVVGPARSSSRSLSTRRLLLSEQVSAAIVTVNPASADLELSKVGPATTRESAVAHGSALQSTQEWYSEAEDARRRRQRQSEPEPFNRAGSAVFLATLVLASCYGAMSLTNWYTSVGDVFGTRSRVSGASMWAQVRFMPPLGYLGALGAALAKFCFAAVCVSRCCGCAIPVGSAGPRGVSWARLFKQIGSFLNLHLNIPGQRTLTATRSCTFAKRHCAKLSHGAELIGCHQT